MTTLIRTEQASPTQLPQAFNEHIYYQLLERVKRHMTAPATRQRESVEERFARLAEMWRSATLLDSSTTLKVSHPAYLAIIAMGEPVVPLILRELTRRPGHWSAALTAITSAVPYPPELRGNMRAIAQAWLEWGRTHGYKA
jgi:hypothetical protein